METKEERKLKKEESIVYLKASCWLSILLGNEKGRQEHETKREWERKSAWNARVHDCDMHNFYRIDWFNRFCQYYLPLELVQSGISAATVS